MAKPTRNLTGIEKGKFIKNNQYGMLSFAGEDPYTILIIMS